LEELRKIAAICVQMGEQYGMLNRVSFGIKMDKSVKNKNSFSKEEVIHIINELLQRPDIIIDACSNEYTDYDAEELLDIALNK